MHRAGPQRKASANHSFETSLTLQPQFHALIPGGCHTYNKGDDQYPEHAPIIVERGEGCHVWDVDGNRFIEYGMGSRSVTLGHAYPRVVEAAYRQMMGGGNFTRPAKIELDYATALVEHIEGAEQVKFAKDGSTVTTAAVKLARAYTGRDMVAVCSDHPFFSYNDWFIGTTNICAGIPDTEKSLTVQFQYNDPASISDLFDRYPGRISCLILEPARGEEPSSNFLQVAMDLCHKNGAVFILDEMITGFRWHSKGAQYKYGIVPDLSAFGKGMANGFALSALMGKRELMEAGGLNTNRERVFLLSTTHGAESHALAAALETLRIYQEEPVVDYLYRQGQKLRDGLAGMIRGFGLEPYFEVTGHPTSLVYVARDRDGNPSQSFRTLVLQELINQGILAPSLTVSYSHSDDVIDETLGAFENVFLIYKKALEDGIGGFLKGRPVKPVYRKYV